MPQQPQDAVPTTPQQGTIGAQTAQPGAVPQGTIAQPAEAQVAAPTVPQEGVLTPEVEGQSIGALTPHTGSMMAAVQGLKPPAAAPETPPEGTASEQMRQILADLLKPPAEQGPSLSSRLALSDFDRQAQEIQRQAREDSALAGRLETGQLGGDAFRAAQQLLGERTRLSGQLAADEEKARRAEIAENRNLAVNVLSQLSGQDHDVRIQRMAQDAETARLQVQHVLNLDTLEKQQAYAKDLEGFRQQYDTLRMREGFGHDQAMAQVQAAIQSRLLAQGFTQDQALQAARLQVEQIENQRNRELEERISTAKMLQDNQQFWANFGLDQQKVAAQVEQIKAQIQNDAKQLGLEETKLNAALQDQGFNRAMQTAALLQELYGDNPDTLQKAADIMWGAMANAGLITKEEMRAGQLNAAADGFKTAADFQAWAKSKGYTDAEIAASVQANSQGGAWSPGGSGAGATDNSGGVGETTVESDQIISTLGTSKAQIDAAIQKNGGPIKIDINGKSYALYATQGTDNLGQKQFYRVKDQAGNFFVYQPQSGLLIQYTENWGGTLE